MGMVACPFPRDIGQFPYHREFAHTKGHRVPANCKRDLRGPGDLDSEVIPAM
jgi:hypothetical protein